MYESEIWCKVKEICGWFQIIGRFLLLFVATAWPICDKSPLWARFLSQMTSQRDRFCFGPYPYISPPDYVMNHHFQPHRPQWPDGRVILFVLPTPDTGIRIGATLFRCRVTERIRITRWRAYNLAIVITIGGRCISETVSIAIRRSCISSVAIGIRRMGITKAVSIAIGRSDITTIGILVSRCRVTKTVRWGSRGADNTTVLISVSGRRVTKVVRIGRWCTRDAPICISMGTCAVSETVGISWRGSDVVLCVCCDGEYGSHQCHH